MRAPVVLAILVAAGCGRFGFGGEAVDAPGEDAAMTDAVAPDASSVTVVPIAGAAVWTTSDTLQRTLATSNPNPGVFTIATWYRSANLGAMPFGSGISHNRQTFIWASQSSGRPVFEHQEADLDFANAPTFSNWPYLDQWVHLVVAVDVTTAVAAERVRWWVNGVAMATDDAGGTAFTQDLDLYFGDAIVHTIGNKHDGAFDWTGALAQTYLIFGHALNASAFVAEVGGQLRSIAYTGPVTPESAYFAYAPAQPAGTNSFAGRPDWTTTALSIATTNLP